MTPGNSGSYAQALVGWEETRCHRTQWSARTACSRKIGTGGMGEVFLAEDPRLGQSVALKRLTGEGVGTDEQLRRLMQEGAAAAALNHPNIAGIYDVLEADGVAHIVMEYVPGETLASRLLRRTPAARPHPPPSPSSCAMAWPPRTPGASCTATSSRRT